jgi:hypothetical protein
MMNGIEQSTVGDIGNTYVFFSILLVAAAVDSFQPNKFVKKRYVSGHLVIIYGMEEEEEVCVYPHQVMGVRAWKREYGQS